MSHRMDLKWTTVMIVILILATACSAETVTDAGSPLVTRKIDDNSTTMAARTEGTLVLRGGCVALEQIDGVLLSIVWPDNVTVWDEELETVTMGRLGRDDFVGLIGEYIELGGGEASSSRGFDYVVRPVSECPDLLWITG